MNQQSSKNDYWVLWLTGAFVFLAISVFVFVMARHKRISDHQPKKAEKDVIVHQPIELGTFRIVRVVDGDSLVLMGLDGLELSVRLRGIDAPELNQPYGLDAKKSLQSLVEVDKVKIDNPKKGKYGRYVVNMFVDGMGINRKMVEGGHAWCDATYTDDKTLCATEQEAKQKNLGLWAISNPIKPEVWRTKQK